MELTLVHGAPEVSDDGESDGVPGALEHLDGLGVGDAEEGGAVDLGDLVVAHDAAAPVRHRTLDHALHEDPAQVLCQANNTNKWLSLSLSF